MNHKTYDECVEIGKQIVNSVNDKQMRICELAMEVCTIRHGGRSDKFYTMKDFAKDIGLNNKTLNQWMLIYRNVVLKLSDKQLENMTWKQASKVNENLEETNTIENTLKGTPRKRPAPSKKLIPAEKVRKLYDEYLEEKPFLNEFLSMVKQTKHSKNLLQKRDLSIVQTSHLTHLMELLDQCSDIINEHLTNQRKRVG